MVKVLNIIYNSNLKKHLMQNHVFARKIVNFKIKDIYKDEFFSNTAPSTLVGSKLWPKVNIGILSPPEKREDVWLYDAQRYWSDNNFNIYKILEFRSSLINSRFRTEVTAARHSGNKLIELAREIGMSKNPVDTEVKLKKKIKIKLYFDETSLPIGARGNLEKLKIGNTKVPQHIEKIYSDTDMKALDAIKYLNKHGYDEQKLSQLLSIGIMGQEKRRVFVPTKWSITSTHSMLANDKLSKIKTCPILNEYRFFSGSYLGNYYFILFLPAIYNYELFETYMPGSFWNPTIFINISTDFEPFKGRTKYVEQTAGGFYATRLGLIEYLDRIKKQASILVLRIESEEYWAGLGVWVVLESVRKTLMNQPEMFNEKSKAIEFFKKKIFERFRFDVTETLSKSKLLDLIKQRKINDF